MTQALAYYNENSDAAADWLENLIAAGLIAPGHVDRRSIKEVQPDDLHGYTQHHFFAGIGGWSRAARLAGWPDTLPLWTGSCPCQPFSVAGKGGGENDPRHLWPDLFRLWRGYRPPVLVGEQVAGKAGYDWFNGVRSDLDREGAAARAVDIPACAIDAPHQRSRQYWVALGDGIGTRLEGHSGHGDREAGWGQQDRSTSAPDDSNNVENANRNRCKDEGDRENISEARFARPQHSYSGSDASHASRGNSNLAGLHNPRQLECERRAEGVQPVSGQWDLHGDGRGDNNVADSLLFRHERRQGNEKGRVVDWEDAGRLEGHSSIASRNEIHRNGTFWSGADWIICHDQKARRVANASAPLLVDGLRGRVVIPRPGSIQGADWPQERHISRTEAWKGFGNAIVPQLAAEVLGALLDTLRAGDAQ